MKPTQSFVNDQKVDWELVVSRIGLVFPKDYMILCEQFGSSCWGNELWIFSPFVRDQHLNMVGKSKNVCEELLDYRFEIQKEFGKEEFDIPVYPEPNGLLFFGSNSCLDHLFWLTEGAPDTWPIIAIKNRDYEYKKFSFNIVTLLGQINAGILSARFFA